MTEHEMYTAVKAKLVAALWPGSVNVVFPTGSVVVCAAIDSEALEKLRKPCVLIKPGSGTPDPEEPDLLKVNVDMVLIAKVGGDSMGSFSLMGRDRANESKSDNAGLLEVQPHLLGAVNLLTIDDDIRIIHKGRGPTAASLLPTGYFSQRGYRFEVWVTAE